jgi:hypothetical protein
MQRGCSVIFLKRVIVSILLAVLFSSSDAVLAQSQKFSVEETEFLVFLFDAHGNEVVTHSNNVPLIPNRACYGWRIQLAGVDGLIKFREVFTLPEEPNFWGGEINEYSPNAISKDRHTSVTEKFSILKNGWISNSWCVAEGDPEGKYSMDVYILGEFIKRFNFNVIKVSRSPDN